MPLLKDYDIFVSHAWDYNSDYYRLVELLKGAPNFKIKNYSVPKHDPIQFSKTSELYRQLREQVRQCSVVIIIAGMYTNYRAWIQAEIEIAREFNKPIIGVRPYGSLVTPQFVTDNVHEIVSWDTQSIVDAIRRRAN